MAKRTKAQKRNDKRLGRMAKAKRRKANKQRKPSKIVAKRRSYRKSFSRAIKRRGGIRGIGGGIVGYARPMAAGIGGAMIASAIADRVAPQYSNMAGYGGAYLAGGIKGLAGKVVFDVVAGGGLFAGTGGQGGGL